MTEPAPEPPIYTGIVTVEELIRYMRNTHLTGDRLQEARSTLISVQEELEIYLNRPVEPVQVREVIGVDHAGHGYFSITPIWKVISVTPMGRLYDLVPYVPPIMSRDPLVGSDGRVHDRTGALLNTTPHSSLYVGPANSGNYLVEYIGGYNWYTKNAVKQQIKRVAAREIARNNDDTINFRDDSAEKSEKADDDVKGWTEEELKKFERYRRRVIL